MPVLDARPSNALGAIHGKGGSHEANSYAVEFLVFFGAADYGGFGEEIGGSLAGPHRTAAGDNDGESGKEGQFVSGEKGEAAPAYFQRGGGIVVLRGRPRPALAPGWGWPLRPGADFACLLGKAPSSVTLLFQEAIAASACRMGGERGEERVHALQHFACFARALHLPP